MTPPSSTPPRRLAILGSRGIPARYGGFETFVEELSTRLVERGHAVTVFCEAGPGPRPLTHRGVALEYVRPWAPGPARTLVADVQGLLRAARRFDVVYLLGYGAAFAVPLARLGGAEVWINPDGLEWRRAKWGRLGRAWLRAMEGLACRLPNRLVFDNRALADEVRGRRLRTVPHTVLEYGAPVVRGLPDPAPLARWGLEPRGYHLVVARAEPENHLLEMARAVASRRTGLPLVIVSNTDRDEPYAHALRALDGERVRVLGPIYDAEPLGCLRSHAFAHLHGHSVGGTNPSLLEALGRGGVVVAHDNPFNREVLGDGGHWFVGQADLVGVLERLEALPADVLERQRDEARARVADWYTWERVADGYAALLEGRERDARGVPGRRVPEPRGAGDRGPGPGLRRDRA